MAKKRYKQDKSSLPWQVQAYCHAVDRQLSTPAPSLDPSSEPTSAQGAPSAPTSGRESMRFCTFLTGLEQVSCGLSGWQYTATSATPPASQVGLLAITSTGAIWQRYGNTVLTCWNPASAVRNRTCIAVRSEELRGESRGFLYSVPPAYARLPLNCRCRQGFATRSD